MMNAIIKELENMGYAVEVREIVKNGMKKQGLVIGEGNIRPTIYPGDVTYKMITEGDVVSASTVAERIAEIYESAKNPDFNTSEMLTLDYFTKHARACLQRTSTEDLVKKESTFPGVEMYMRVIDEGKSFKITSQFVKSLNISEDEAWTIAIKNTLDNVKIRNLGEVLGFGGELPMWMISNEYLQYGAGSILALDSESVSKYTDADSIYIIPSSVHECIFVPADISDDVNGLIEMVKAVNSAEVDPIEQLADEVFTLKLR